MFNTQLSHIKMEKSYKQNGETDANGNKWSYIEKIEKECPEGYVIVWNRWEKGFKYRKLDKDGYVEDRIPTPPIVELSCVNCDVYIARDSQEHDEAHINEDDKIFCRDCLDKCNCFCCNEDRDVCTECGYYQIGENEKIYGNICECDVEPYCDLCEGVIGGDDEDIACNCGNNTESEDEEDNERCWNCDRNAYHKNDWHCSQGKTKKEDNDSEVNCIDCNGSGGSRWCCEECGLHTCDECCYNNDGYILCARCGEGDDVDDESGFGTAYHDGTGFADCDPNNKGNRLCKDYDKSEWCSECIYLSDIRQLVAV